LTEFIYSHFLLPKFAKLFECRFSNGSSLKDKNRKTKSVFKQRFSFFINNLSNFNHQLALLSTKKLQRILIQKEENGKKINIETCKF